MRGVSSEGFGGAGRRLDASTGRPAKRLSDHRLQPGETRTLSFEVDAPTAVRLTIDVKHVRLNATNALYAAKAPADDEIRALRPTADGDLARLWEHYPLFAYLYREERALPSLERVLDSSDQLAKRSASAQRWSVERLRLELEPSPATRNPKADPTGPDTP